jgi:hypothetical protein
MIEYNYKPLSKCTGCLPLGRGFPHDEMDHRSDRIGKPIQNHFSYLSRDTAEEVTLVTAVVLGAKVSTVACQIVKAPTEV